jgi:hypothetical protein
MDITAPFLPDMGLCMPGIESLREAFRTRIAQEPNLFRTGGAAEMEIVQWLDRLEAILLEEVSDGVRQQFWSWIKNTYTMVPADRPNWEMYDMFFSQWSVGMRSGNDTAGCFADPGAVYDAYYAFVRARRLGPRIEESRQRKLSAWDARIFVICDYSLSEDEIDDENVFDPFAVVDATASRNYFQTFWEYLLPQLSQMEATQLFQAVRRYDMNGRMPDLVEPNALQRIVR